MIDRAAVVGAVAAELDERVGRCVEEHGAIGARVADRLGLVERDHKPDNVVHPLERLGTGVFIRRISDWPIEVLARFGWACVAVISGQRARLNRDAAWWRDASAAGVRLTAMDWLPTPATWRSGLAEAIAWSAEHGSLCYVTDAEGPSAPRGWNGAVVPARAYVAEMQRLTAAAGCGLGVTALALPPASYPRILIEGCPDLAITQPYDRDHALDAAYPVRSSARYVELGARPERIVVGRGAFRRERGRGGELVPRWRTPGEIEAHRATTPAGTAATCWWPPVGRMPPRVVDAIVG